MSKVKSVVFSRPWVLATVIFVVLLLRGIIDPVGSQVDRFAQFVWLGVGFAVCMVGVGALSRWLERRDGVVFGAIDWIVVVMVALLAGLLLGYLAVVENLIFCVDPSGRVTDCNSSMTERLTLIILAGLGWAIGAWIALHGRGPVVRSKAARADPGGVGSTA
ncbi:MAG: hypothetical protein HYX32_05780 [Actinobacteria bacterium]|nr:hypothetical protein [Actinomycetota bacterium]